MYNEVITGGTRENGTLTALIMLSDDAESYGQCLSIAEEVTCNGQEGHRRSWEKKRRRWGRSRCLLSVVESSVGGVSVSVRSETVSSVSEGGVSESVAGVHNLSLGALQNTRLVLWFWF